MFCGTTNEGSSCIGAGATRSTPYSEALTGITAAIAGGKTPSAAAAFRAWSGFKGMGTPSGAI